MTMDVMAHSLVYWAQDVVGAGLLGPAGRIYAMTSSGARVAWHGYGAVSAAKSALESHVRQLAMELGGRGITANSVLAGVTRTPALDKIPGADVLAKRAAARNPGGRLTTPDDVARALVKLADADLQWLNGGVLHLDGGEEIAG
jgi:NAD(P)-dependent dehydrogenase (short-subunit alcohol dehydrogenase family)